jgi:hypothetical protein
MAKAQKAIAVDTAFKTLMGDKKELTLTGNFLRSWAEKARNLGGSGRIIKAIQKLKVKVVHIHSCASQYLASNRWFIQFAWKVVILSPLHTN